MKQTPTVHSSWVCLTFLKAVVLGRKLRIFFALFFPVPFGKRRLAMKNPDVLSENYLQSMFHCYMGVLQTCSFVILANTQLQGDLRIGPNDPKKGSLSFAHHFCNGANDVSLGEGYLYINIL